MADIKKLKENLNKIGTHAKAYLASFLKDDLWVGVTINEIQEILEKHENTEIAEEIMSLASELNRIGIARDVESGKDLILQELEVGLTKMTDNELMLELEKRGLITVVET